MGALALLGRETKSLYSAVKSLPFSRSGGNAYGGSYGGNWNGSNSMFLGNSLPGAQYDYQSAAGVLWENPSAAACFVALTKAFAQARPILEKRTGKNWELVEKSPLISLLSKPNKFYSGEKLFGVTLISAMSNGAGFWRLERNGTGAPSEIWFEPPVGIGATGIAPTWDATDFIKEYIYFVDGKRHETPLKREDVVYFRHGLNVANPRLPWAPLGLAAREIATLNGASTYTSALMRNSAVPSGMLSMDSGITGTAPTPDQALEMKAKIKAGFKGENVGEPFVTSTPWKWTPFNWSPSELSIDKLRSWPQGTVCALLGTPEDVALLPTGERPTYQNLDAAMRWWWDHTIIPLEDAFADEIETQLFEAFDLDTDDYRMAWDRSRVPALREDEIAKYGMIGDSYKSGILDLFDARTALSLEADDEMKGVRHPLATPKPEGTDAPTTDDIQKQNQVDAARKNWDESSHPRADDGKFGNGGGAGSYVHGLMDAPHNDHVSLENKAKFKESAAQVIEAMPETARKALADNMQNAPEQDDVYAPSEPGIFMANNLPELQGKFNLEPYVLAQWQTESNQLFIDGGDIDEPDRTGTFAHEFAHIIDGAAFDDDGVQSKGMSTEPEWKEAYYAEICIKGSPLSTYAKTHHSEGFAEFARLVWAGDKSQAERFPKSAAFFKKKGLL